MRQLSAPGISTLTPARAWPAPRPRTYQVGEVEQVTGVSRQTLDEWEDSCGLLNTRRHERTNHRLYTAQDIERIHFLRECVFTKHIAAQDMKFICDRMAMMPPVPCHEVLKPRARATHELLDHLTSVTECLNTALASWRDVARPIEDGLLLMAEPIRAAFAAESAQCWLVNNDTGMDLVGTKPTPKAIAREVARAARAAWLARQLVTRVSRQGATQVLAFPLTLNQQCYGALTITRAHAMPLTCEERRFGALIAKLAANAVASADACSHLRSLDRIIETIGDGIVLKDRELRPFLYNEAALSLAMNREEIQRARCQGEPPPTPIWDTSHPGGGDILATDLPSVRAIATGERTVNMVMEVRPDPVTAPKRVVPLLTTATTWTDDDGMVSGAVVTLRDISPVKALEQAKERFLKRGLHDMRGSLTMLKVAPGVYTKLANRLVSGDISVTDAAADLRLWAKRMENSMVNIERQLEDMRDPSRFISGELSMVSLYDLVKGYVGELLSDYGMERIVPHFFAADTRMVGNWCRKDIESLVRNLVENALKYSPSDKPVHIQLYTRRDARGRYLACLVVQDFGYGIVSEDVERIFDENFRSHPGKPEGIHGTGLGLYFCAQTVRGYDGRLWAVSDGPDKGSTFYLELPLLEPEELAEG